MSEFASYVTLDSVIREMCSDCGDNYAHDYMVKLSHAVQFIRQYDHENGGFKGVKYMWLPVVDGRANVPNIVSISKVGIEIGGHIQPLLEDLNMLDRLDDCGGFTTNRPLNPDVPSVRSDSVLPILFTGPYSGLWGTYGYGGYRGYGYGLYGNSFSAYYPGMSVKKSLYGYYRWFPQNGYILLDADSTWETIVIEVAVKTFEPGSITLVPEIAVEVIKSYVRWAITDLDADVKTKSRPIVSLRQQQLTFEKLRLRKMMRRQPLYEVWAVLR